jgi:hypothetical protein
VVEQEVDGVFQPTRVVPGKDKVETLNLLFLTIDHLGLAILQLSINNVLSLQLVDDFSCKFGRAEVVAKLRSGGEGQVMRFRNHAL